MKILLTAGPTREPIDPVRYIGNRSSGRMGIALAEAALRAGHDLTLILGPIVIAPPSGARRIDIQTAAQMHDAVLAAFPSHDVLIMAAAVADYSPIQVSSEKIAREENLGTKGKLTIVCQATPDIAAAAGRMKRADQRTIGFSLEAAGNLDRAREKLTRKNFDLIVYNPIGTMESDAIEPTLLWRDGRTQPLPASSKARFAEQLIEHIEKLPGS